MIESWTLEPWDGGWLVRQSSNKASRSEMSDYQMLVAGEVVRGKYRNSFERPEPMVPCRVTEIEFDLRDRYHRFLTGHRIMVQVQST